MMVYHYLVVSACMFGIGVYGLISRRNIIRILLSAEVVFNSALIALLALSSISADPSTGGLMALLAITIAAAEVGVTVSIALLMFTLRKETDVYHLEKFKG